MRKSSSKIAFSWRTLAMLVLVALSVQGCLGSGSGSPKGNFKNLGGSSNLQVNSDTSFDGSIYFTNNHNLFMIDGKGNSKQLSSGVTVQDPALSPNGKLLAFVIRYKNYSDLMMMSTSGGWNSRKTILSGKGKFTDLSNNSFYWFAQPSWAPDNEHLLFASDLQKEYYWNRNPGYNDSDHFPDAPFLDLQIFDISIKNIPTIASEDTMQYESGAYTNPAYAQNYAVAYATYGDGGDLNPQFRPGSSKEFIFTHYQYDASTGTKQQIQIAMGNTEAISKSDASTYNPNPKGDMQTGDQPAVALSSPEKMNLMPSFSPDGSAIAFIQRDPNGVDSHLNIMSSPPSGVTNGNFHDASMKSAAIAPYNKTSVSLLTQQFISQPVWSPDGKQIAYLSYANETFDIWIVNVKLNPNSGRYEKVGDPMQVTNGGVDGDNRLVWSR